MADQPVIPRAINEASLANAIIPLVTLMVLIASAIALFSLDALDGPIPTALVICAMVAALFAGAYLPRRVRLAWHRADQAVPALRR
jgi:hypothetical protein